MLIPLGFEGGHGVVAGTKSTFEELDYRPGYNLAMVGATVGAPTRLHSVRTRERVEAHRAESPLLGKGCLSGPQWASFS